MAIKTIVLTEAARRALAEAADEVAKFDLVNDTERFVSEAHVQSAALPEELRREIQHFGRFGNRDGGIVIDGIPIGAIPDTPPAADLAVGATLREAALMSILLALLGEQIGYRPEMGGNLVQDVLPVPGDEHEQVSTGALVDLKTHVEMAFSEFRSDYVALQCLRADHEGAAGTTLSSIDRMLPMLDEQTIRTLRAPLFRTKVDKSFLRGDALTDDVWIDDNVRILSESETRARLRVDFAETEGMTPEAVAALERLNEAAVATQQLVRLRPGQMIICDNNRALHGRTVFEPRYDGQDRWLLRAFITKDLRKSELVRPGDGRIIEPDYTSLLEMKVTDHRRGVPGQY